MTPAGPVDHAARRPGLSRRPRRGAARPLAIALVLSAMVANGCGSTRVRPTWVHAVVPAAGAVHIGAVLAGDQAGPWLLAGSIAVPGKPPHVAFYSAARPGAAWRMASAAAVGPDGPEDTIEGLGRKGTTAVAFGWYDSPNHGIPRPSPWVSGQRPGEWREVPTVRELFSGENVVTLGDVTGGARGFTIAGAWVNAVERAVATVWRSSDGRQWHRVDSDAVLAGAPGEITSALGVADGPAGLAVVGDALVPTRADPGGERGAVWESDDGTTWRRLAPGDPTLGEPGAQVRLDHVAATSTGWSAVGSWSAASGHRVVVWSWGPAQPLVATTLAHVGRISSTAVAASGTTVVVGAIVDGAPLVWISSASPGGRFRPVTLPDAVRSQSATTLFLALGGGYLLVAADAPNGGQVWWATMER